MSKFEMSIAITAVIPTTYMTPKMSSQAATSKRTEFCNAENPNHSDMGQAAEAHQIPCADHLSLNHIWHCWLMKSKGKLEKGSAMRANLMRALLCHNRLITTPLRAKITSG